ncbi:cytochrome-c peroxidase [Methyloversatilis thermotolerans]|uniref:cytochrome-c peroxidase n=1 Tax=Methyloversatilis thermotolerans TaxID=1346290 RepID=UPI001E2D3F1E|nr:cytochrome c peroxidase [Methyloversatilis thermotolerans]
MPIPEVPGLLDGPEPVVVDHAAAIALGKALFWDSNVGSDGMACASCHFHAGADRRVRNQVAPNGAARMPASTSFEPGVDGQSRGANYTLRRGDFPLVEAASPLEAIERYGFLRTSDDVVGSAGSFSGQFGSVSIEPGEQDRCAREADDVFHVRGVGARKVTQRNAPSVINAVFNHRNFWDGRANNVFNGSSTWGDRDPDAGVWVRQADGRVAKERLRLVNASLASLALSPPVDVTEMSCSGRTFADLGRKLMWRRPLESQRVHPEDSVLGPLALSSATQLRPGLNTWYALLIRKAFNRKYWSYGSRGAFGAPAAQGGEAALPYSQMEANFGMFFGLALQTYMATLVSDDTPFDRSARDADGTPIDLTAQQQRGFVLFREAHCNQCHVGPAFTSVALDAIARQVRADRSVLGAEFPASATGSVVTRFPTLGGTGFQDAGFMATGVVEDDWDVGIAGLDPWGHPLSFAVQYMDFLAGNDDGVVDAEVRSVRACDMAVSMTLNLPVANASFFTQRDGLLPQPVSTENCFNASAVHIPVPAAAQAARESGSRKMRSAISASFKIPGLRNVELTGPYMHNGSMATLEQVIEFYTRGGNFSGQSKQINFVFEQTQLLEAEARADLLAFLKSLTDDRVRYARAPFDHPELIVPHGHPGDHLTMSTGAVWGSDLASDVLLQIPAVGARGMDEALPSFESQLAP